VHYRFAWEIFSNDFMWRLQKFWRNFYFPVSPYRKTFFLSRIFWSSGSQRNILRWKLFIISLGVIWFRNELNPSSQSKAITKKKIGILPIWPTFWNGTYTSKFFEMWQSWPFYQRFSSSFNFSQGQQQQKNFSHQQQAN